MELDQVLQAVRRMIKLAEMQLLVHGENAQHIVGRVQLASD